MDQQSFKVTNWQKSLEAEGCHITETTVLADIKKSDGRALFTLLDVNATTPEGYKLPPIVFIRGHAVITVPLLVNSETGEERFLMVYQRRIGNGCLCLEFPAGMIDNNGDTPHNVAIIELYEETGLVVTPDELFPLSPIPYYSSAGASDEAIFYFGCIKHLSKGEFNSFSGKQCGNSNEHEQLTVALLTRREAEPQLTSLQAQLGFFLFEQYLQPKVF